MQTFYNGKETPIIDVLLFNDQFVSNSKKQLKIFNDSFFNNPNLKPMRAFFQQSQPEAYEGILSTIPA